MSAKYKQQGAHVLSNLPLSGPSKRSAKPADDSDLSDLQSRIAALGKLADVRQRTIDDLSDQISRHHRKNEQLLKQITEMTDFLADYGLYWRGGPGPQFASFPDGPLDMGRFEQRIADLNKLADSVPAALATDGGVTTIAHTPVFRLTLLNDGFTLNEGPLRPYSDPASGLFIQDIVDGFFPGEFKANFPNGVKFTLDDRRAVDRFHGPARRLVESARREPEPDGPLGHGDGKVKIRMPNTREVMVAIEKGTKVRQLRRIVQAQFGVEEFELTAPPAAADLDDDMTMAAAGLYPKGLVMVRPQKAAQ
jgi:uncharacterized coiled-coil protein SlyX